MNDHVTQLLTVTGQYKTLKRLLEAKEREYNNIYAQVYLSERVSGMKTEEMRKNEMIRIMENEHGEFITELQNLRGDTREKYYMREALAIILGGKQHENS